MKLSRRLMLTAMSMVTASLFSVVTVGAQAPTDIELFFPVPVDGALAKSMTTLITEFNSQHPNEMPADKAIGAGDPDDHGKQRTRN